MPLACGGCSRWSAGTRGRWEDKLIMCHMTKRQIVTTLMASWTQYERVEWLARRHQKGLSVTFCMLLRATTKRMTALADDAPTPMMSAPSIIAHALVVPVA